jgi:hypothetical protein
MRLEDRYGSGEPRRTAQMYATSEPAPIACQHSPSLIGTREMPALGLISAAALLP